MSVQCSTPRVSCQFFLLARLTILIAAWCAWDQPKSSLWKTSHSLEPLPTAADDLSSNPWTQHTCFNHNWNSSTCCSAAQHLHHQRLLQRYSGCNFGVQGWVEGDSLTDNWWQSRGEWRQKCFNFGLPYAIIGTMVGKSPWTVNR